ncbi:MAG: hypothetical protein VXZ72_02335 [Chlamydiota bacterium]|nr:hypothetical protein [Chlamydiota bacterium]
MFYEKLAQAKQEKAAGLFREATPEEKLRQQKIRNRFKNVAFMGRSKNQEKTAMDFGVRYNINHARKSTKLTERELKALRDKKYSGKRVFDDEVEDAYVRNAQRRARLLGAGAGVVAGGLLGYGLKRGMNSAKNSDAIHKAFQQNFGVFDKAKQVKPTLINEAKGTIPYALGGAALGGLGLGAGLGYLAEHETRVDVDRAREAHMRELMARAAIRKR